MPIITLTNDELDEVLYALNAYKFNNSFDANTEKVINEAIRKVISSKWPITTPQT